MTKIDWVPFYGRNNLKSVTIPPSVTTFDYDSHYDIGKDGVKRLVKTYAFMECPNIVIYGKAGSAAETHAKAYNLTFKAVNM